VLGKNRINEIERVVGGKILHFSIEHEYNWIMTLFDSLLLAQILGLLLR
jgi:hypothetical protein